MTVGIFQTMFVMHVLDTDTTVDFHLATNASVEEVVKNTRTCLVYMCLCC